MPAHATALGLCTGLTALKIACHELFRDVMLHPVSCLTALQSLCVDLDLEWSEDWEFLDVAGGVSRVSALTSLTQLHLTGLCFKTAVHEVAMALTCMPRLCEFQLDCQVRDRLVFERMTPREVECGVAPVLAALPQLELLSRADIEVCRLEREDMLVLLNVLPLLRGVRLRVKGNGGHVAEALLTQLKAAAPAGVEVFL